MKKININELKPMCQKEASKFFGKKMWSKMKQTDTLKNSSQLNINDKKIYFSSDLYSAYLQIK